MSETNVSVETYDAWLEDNGPAAIVIRQPLRPVNADPHAEDEIWRRGVFFPPTYAGGQYNIDRIGDPDKNGAVPEVPNVCVVDSVGSQANRIEPAFKTLRFQDEKGTERTLVPQVVVQFKEDLKDENGKVVEGDDGKPKQQVVDEVHLLDAGHRAADAVMRSSDLKDEVEDAFIDHREGDATAMAQLCPTTLVFGAWDSRATQHKVSRIVSAIIRAYNVRELRRSPRYKPPKDYILDDIIPDHGGDKATKERYSQEGVLDFVDPVNPFVHGGVIAERIVREATLNLATIRDLRAGDGQDKEKNRRLQRYILGLSLVAITHLDAVTLSLRQGCQLVKADPDDEGIDDKEKERRQPRRYVVQPNGKNEVFNVNDSDALRYAQNVAADFIVGEDRTCTFDKEILETSVSKKSKDAWKERKASAEERYRRRKQGDEAKGKASEASS